MVFTNFCIESVYLATRKKEGREWYWQIATSFLQPLIWIVSFSLSSMSSISIRILRLYPLLSLASRGDKRKAFVSKIRSILTTRIRQLFLFKEGRRRGEGDEKYGGQPEYIEAIPFICLYYTYNIWVSKSVDPGNFSP